MNIKINPIKRDDIKKYQHQYYASIGTPFDDYWANAIIANGSYYEIIHHEPIGYMAINHDNILLQFYLYSARKEEVTILKKCIELLNITTAHVSTYEANYLGRCLDLGLSYDVIALFYQHTDTISINKPFEDIEETLVEAKHLEEAVTFAVTEGGPRELLSMYYKSLIKIKGLYIYKHNNQIIGTGELRTYYQSDKIANIGMTVSKDHRNKGVGSYILNRMTVLSYKNNLTPICGTDIDNIASQRTIENCGFYPYHRALQFDI